MRIGIFLNYAGGFSETVVELADYERAGLDIVFVPEAYSFDAVSQLGFIAAKTDQAVGDIVHAVGNIGIIGAAVDSQTRAEPFKARIEIRIVLCQRALCN